MKKEIWYLKSLKRAYARKLIEEELMDRIKELEKEILYNFTPWNNDKIYSKNDLNKIERLILKQFIELPDNLINALDIIEAEEEQI